MTKLDVLTGLGDLEVVVGYVVDGQRYGDYPAHLPTIEGVEVETETLSGWDEDVSGARSYDDLPPAARAFVERVAELVGTPIVMLSVGAERDAVIVRSPILGEDWSVDAPAREGALS